jgi:hypothetical protein
MPPTTIDRAALGTIISETFGAISKLNDTKGREYAGDGDALANFKRRGEQLDLDPLKVWGIFAGKHWDAVLSFIRHGKVLSEPIEGRIDDLILYLILLKGLIEERAETAREEQLVGARRAMNNAVALAVEDRIRLMGGDSDAG